MAGQGDQTSAKGLSGKFAAPGMRGEGSEPHWKISFVRNS